MDELDIKLLERRVDELIRMVERLRDENRLLRESHSGLIAERARLMEKTELARSRVEEMIEHLKGLEQES
jgi:cell division protein ZapB